VTSGDEVEKLNRTESVGLKSQRLRCQLFHFSSLFEAEYGVCSKMGDAPKWRFCWDNYTIILNLWIFVYHVFGQTHICYLHKNDVAIS
jgi:hypothetical protein